MEGLEISEILRSELEYSGRLDSEYYRKHLLFYEDQICKKSFTQLDRVATFLIGPFGSAFDTENYIEDGDYRYVRGQDVKPFILKDGENRYVPYEDFERLKKYALKEEDILVSVVGTLGNACIVQKRDLPAIFSCKSTVIRTSTINPVYTLTFLNCKYGRELLIRKERGAIQKGLNLDDLKTTLIPEFSEIFQLKVEKIFYNAQSKIAESKSLYSSAETLLLETLGLSNFEPSAEPVNVKGFKESFLATGRLDAEYYQKKYEEYDKIIKENGCGFTFISVEYSLVKSGSSKDKDTYNYIEIGDVNVNDGSATHNSISTSELPANAKTEVKKGDILISKVRSNRGAVTIIDSDAENLIVSGAFTVLREKKTSVFSNETLKVLLRTNIYKDWLLQFNIGTQYPVIRDEDIINMPIPKISKEIQESITKQIQDSQKLKKQSEHLLETAKRAVEIAIEQDEEAAMRYIDEAQRAST